MATTAPPTVLHLSLIVGGTLRDRNGGRLGKVDDLIVRLGEDYPPVTGVLATVAGRPLPVPVLEQIAEIEHGRIHTTRRGAARPAAVRAARRRAAAPAKTCSTGSLINVDGV